MSDARTWRVGRKVGRTIYEQVGSEPSDDDRLIGMMDTPELAEGVVAAREVHVKLFAGAEERLKEPAEPVDAMRIAQRLGLVDRIRRECADELLAVLNQPGVSLAPLARKIEQARALAGRWSAPAGEEEPTYAQEMAELPDAARPDLELAPGAQADGYSIPPGGGT